MKLQINSLEALERLIGGDTEVELDIRNSVVQAFAKKHLKPLATMDSFVEIKRDLEKVAMDTATQFIGQVTGNIWNRDIKINPHIEKRIRENAERSANNAVQNAIDLGVQDANSRYTDKLIGNIVDKHVTRGIAEKVDAAVKAKLEAVATGLTQ